MNANLPVKSTSKGIQQAHTRRIQTRQGPKEVIVNPSVHKPVTIERAYPSVSHRQEVAVRQPTQPVAQLQHVVNIPPKKRPGAWWNDLEQFKKRAMQKENIADAAESVYNPDTFWSDVIDMVSPILNEKEAEEALDRLNEDFADGGENLLLNMWGGKDHVTAQEVRHPDNIEEISRWWNTGRMVGIGEDGNPDGPGQEFALIEVKGRLDNSDFEVDDEDLMSYLKQGRYNNSLDDKIARDEYQTVTKVKELAKKMEGVYALFPSTWYHDTMIVAVPKAKAKEAKDFLKDVLSEDQH